MTVSANASDNALLSPLLMVLEIHPINHVSAVKRLISLRCIIESHIGD